MRTIACEADGNMCLQLAFDSYAKSRLRRKGLNLSDQTRNQELARDGSIDGKLATVDMSMASDTLAYNVIPLLFNYEWFSYLRAIRSQGYSLYVGQKEKYHKFSSMGNGSTFPIETLVFAAACSAVGSRSYRVYGDDIIIERELVGDLFALLAFLGFVPNESKTHTTGPFRESCGRSWFKGFDVTPRYIRAIDERKPVLCHLVNSMMSIADEYGSLIDYLANIVCEYGLPCVPYNESSISGVWLYPSFAYEKKVVRTKHFIARFKAFVPKIRVKSCFDSRALFLWYLRRCHMSGLPDEETLSREPLLRFIFRNSDARFSLFLSGNLDEGYEEPDVSSRYSISSHKYVRKWVHWIPVAGAPDQLYRWSEIISRNNR
jgi:hypothetical protein